MRYNRIIISILLLLVTVGFTSCYDEKMDWDVERKGDPIDVSEIPLTLQEQILALGALKSYGSFPVGMGVDLTLYMEKEEYRNLVNENFDVVTVGYHMKHGAMVGSDGELRTTAVDQFVKLLPSDMELFGHTLVWHQNQNGAYLRSLIAPTVLPPSEGESILDISGLQDGSFTGWGKWNNPDGMTIESSGGLSDGDPVIKLVTTGSSANEWDTQLASPEMPAIEGHAYMFSFWIKSEPEGQGRISFEGMSDGYPWYDGAALWATNGSWRQINYGADGSLTATSNKIRMVFDLGKVPGVTYYIDINTIEVIDLDAEPSEYNYVTNGNFETGDLSNWTIANNGVGIQVVDAEKYEGSYSCRMQASPTSANAWDLQLQSDAIALEAGKTYTLSFFVKSDREGKGRISFPGFNNEWPWMNWQGTGASEAFTTTTSWQYVSVDLNAEYKDGSNTVKLSFDLGYINDATYWIDDVRVVAKESASGVKGPLRAGPTIIEKTDEEKRDIITASMTKWINEVTGYYKDRVKAWDVVNEPMADDGNGVRHGDYNGDSEDIFHWQDFMGDDFAVTAFKLAREAGAEVLFINDFNLEYNLTKCRALITYVNHIESLGAKVDGIGTQMHISTDQNMDNVAEHFKLLAATGKLIKISELDVKVGTDSPTTEQLMLQSEVYQQVVELYREHIPAAQQYGITLWSLTDGDSWIEGDAPCLWYKNYARKVAYKGFADGLNN